MSKLNAQVLQVTRSLKRNGSSAPDLLHQNFPAYLVCSDVRFNAYIALKQNSFEEGMTYKPNYLIRCARYKYHTLKERGEWEASSAKEEQIIALRVEINNLKTKISLKNAQRNSKKKGTTSPTDVSNSKSCTKRSNHH